MNLAASRGQARSGASREFRDDHRAGDRGGAPCGEQRPMDRADVFRAEHVREKRRDGSESAAIHAENREERHLEDHPVAAVASARDQQKETELRKKENDVGVAPANVVRKEAQKNRPPALNRLIKRDHGGGSAGVFWNISCIMGEA